MNERIKLSKQSQKDFFQKIKTVSGKSWDELASSVGLSGRTFRDWARAKYTPLASVIDNLSKTLNLSLPIEARPLDAYWYIKKWARKGALARQKKYGLLGDRETRRRAGIISQQRRREDPEKYRKLGCLVKKNIKPLKPSDRLAELCGVLLGDGGLTDNQVKITLNKKTDKDYGTFVSRLMYEVLGEKPKMAIRGSVLVFTLSSVAYIEAFERMGLKRGNKVRQQVGIPEWILRNKKYSKFCLRGLVDTDGGVYFHHHIVAKKRYINFGLSFTNASLPIILGAKKILESFKLKVFMPRQRNLYIYKFEDIQRYFQIIGSDNPKHWQRLKIYQKICKII